MNYKKPAVWIVLLAIAAFAVVSVCFATTKKNDDNVEYNFTCDYGSSKLYSKEDMDDKCKKLLDELKDQHYNPDYDRVKTISFILANYPCFNAAIISYISADPNRYGKLSYEVKIRSNTVAIKMMDAKNHSTNLN